MLKAGIVGLPNVGKSTLFNAVTRTRKAEAANYPFCTIEPNMGIVTVPDARLEVLGKLSKTQKIVPAAIEFVDIAGLVKGASQGEGLGNQFLSHIRECDAIVQVVRCFEDKDIHHVSGTIDPLRDIDVINTELVLADLASVEKRLQRASRQAKSGDKESKAEAALCEKLIPHLNDGKPAITPRLNPAARSAAPPTWRILTSSIGRNPNPLSNSRAATSETLPNRLMPIAFPLRSSADLIVSSTTSS